MKILLTLALLSSSLTSFANSTIKHYNCEIFIQKEGLDKFLAETKIARETVEMTLKEKGFTDVRLYAGPISNYYTQIIGSLLTLSLLENVEGNKGSARYDINEHIQILGTQVGVTKIESMSVSGKKALLQTTKSFKKQLGKEVLKQLPNCDLE
jgi:hypothetical protein